MRNRLTTCAWAFLALVLLVTPACEGVVSSKPRAAGVDPPRPSPEQRAVMERLRRHITDEILRESRPLKARIDAWLVDGGFEAIDRALGDLLQRHKDGEIAETTLRDATRHASWSATWGPTARPDALARWVAERPHSWAAHVSVAIVQAWLAFDARGEEASRDTPDRNFERMRAHFSSARAHLARVIELEPRVMVAYEELIKMERASGSKDACRAWVEQAARAYPQTYHVRVRLQYCLVPRWGGSYPSMRAAAVAGLEHADANPLLRLLPGYEQMDRASEMRRRGRLDRAMKHINLALAFGPQPSWLGKRADLHMRRGHLRAAVADQTAALEAEPWRSLHRRRRGRAHGAMGNLDAALADLDQVIRRAPNYSQAWRDRGWVREKHGAYEAAEQDFARADALEREQAYDWSQPPPGT